MKWPTRTDARVAAVLAVVVVAAGVCRAGEAGLPPEAAPQKSYYPYPTPDHGYVTDLAGLLTSEQEERIEQWLIRVEKMTGVEIIVVTVQSIAEYPGSANDSITDFATGLFNTYGIGNRPANNGVLFLVASADRKARIELGAGYGRERDEDASRIMNTVVVPCFSKGKYASGITKGTRAIVREFAGVQIGLNWPVIIVAAAIPVVALIAMSLFRNGKRGWGWVCVGLLVILLLLLVHLLRAALTSSEGSSSSWSAGGSGGFGGGFSGGGGATGSW